MALLVDKKIGNDTSRLRLTIQIDLSGFSFKISNSLGEFLHSYHADFPVGAFNADDIEIYIKKEVESQPLLNKEYAAVRVYYGTEKYCLVPVAFFKKENAMKMLSGLHKIEYLDEVMFVDIPEQKAVLIYAIPNAVTTHIFRVQKNAEFYPVSYFLLDKTSFLLDNNRVLINISHNIVHIVASERDKLLIANSYPASDFVTAEYYLFLVIKEVMFNPESTILQVSGNITAEQENELKRYFKGINKQDI
jgi:hypothetical protein